LNIRTANREKISTDTPITEQHLLDDFSSGNWLKKQISETNLHDLIDALKDAELLVQVIEQRYVSIGLNQK